MRKSHFHSFCLCLLLVLQFYCSAVLFALGDEINKPARVCLAKYLRGVTCHSAGILRSLLCILFLFVMQQLNECQSYLKNKQADKVKGVWATSWISFVQQMCSVGDVFKNEGTYYSAVFLHSFKCLKTKQAEHRKTLTWLSLYHSSRLWFPLFLSRKQL